VPIVADDVLVELSLAGDAVVSPDTTPLVPSPASGRTPHATASAVSPVL